MQTRDIVGLTSIPIALLVAAGTLNVVTVGSIVWFCGLLASAVLILALLSFCYNFSPSTIPLRSFYLVYLASVWFCGLLASAVLILALLSFCYNFSPSTIPLRSFYLVYLASVIVVGIGTIVRICFHEELKSGRLLDIALAGRQHQENNWAFVIITGIYEWLSFAVILFCVFFAVRVFARGNLGTSQADQSVPQRQ